MGLRNRCKVTQLVQSEPKSRPRICGFKPMVFGYRNASSQSRTKNTRMFCSFITESYLDDTHIVFNYTEKLLESNLKRITVVQYTATLAEVNQ